MFVCRLVVVFAEGGGLVVCFVHRSSTSGNTRFLCPSKNEKKRTPSSFFIRLPTGGIMLAEIYHRMFKCVAKTAGRERDRDTQLVSCMKDKRGEGECRRGSQAQENSDFGAAACTKGAPLV